MPYVGIMFLMAIVLVLFPQVATFLPELLK
jgi:C4-dicarboxylate transporter DctM subunit